MTFGVNLSPSAPLRTFITFGGGDNQGPSSKRRFYIRPSVHRQHLMLRAASLIGRPAARRSASVARSPSLSRASPSASAPLAAAEHVFLRQQPSHSFLDPSRVDWTAPSNYELTRKQIEEATTLPGSVYHDPAFHAVEKKTLWRNSWIAVAELADVAKPGDVLPVTVAGAPLLLAMDNKGELRTFHNVCRHRGAQLVDKKCEKRRTILCPCTPRRAAAAAALSVDPLEGPRASLHAH